MYTINVTIKTTPMQVVTVMATLFRELDLLDVHNQCHNQDYSNASGYSNGHLIQRVGLT